MSSAAVASSTNQSTTTSSTTYLRGPTPTSTTAATTKTSDIARASKGGKAQATLRITDNSDDSIDPLPSELRRILSEVAQTGACPWLSWNNKSAAKEERTSRIQFFVPKQRADAISQPAQATKKRRNGIHSRRRIGAENPVIPAAVGKKRARTTFSATLSLSAQFSGAASVGSRGTSGSEVEDSPQYECDSEGTTTTTNSEFSTGDRRKRGAKAATSSLSQPVNSKHKSLRSGVAVAVLLVLDQSYRSKGYKLSPAEQRLGTRSADTKGRNGMAGVKDTPSENQGSAFGNGPNATMSSREAFDRRRDRLLSMLGYRATSENGEIEETRAGGESEEPPFTIQRLAEVLVAPERYYSQTHKLCNCLEKLLLVNAPINAFGGISGGETSQTRREDEEIAALADEKERLESEQRNRRLRRRMSASSVDDDRGVRDDSLKKEDAEYEQSTREALEAKAKASLHYRFDHAGAEVRAKSVMESKDIREITEARSLANSPPPPSLLNAAHSPLHGFVRHSPQDQHKQLHDPNGSKGVVGRAPSPIIFSPSEAGSNPIVSAALPNQGLQVLQMNHTAALAGILGNSTPLDVVINPGSPFSGLAGSPATHDQDLEADPGRSSASNSDVDSESDDISFDDSASDRSDGSDSGSGHYEPFTAARVMALNRKQQQQQRSQQSRLGDFRPPADTEYQSGDSIDSTLAEDSGGSDSSSSDLAD